jgi:thiol-disulfide isomerase/thioredoxin
MTPRFRLFLVALALLLALSAGFAPRSALADPSPPVAAPAWHLTDLDGHVLSSADFKGKVVVLDFWAVWCAPCKTEIPGYVDLQKKYGADGLVIIGVVYDKEEPARVKQFVDQYQVSYRIALGNDEIENAFGGMDSIPTTFLIDRDGIIRDRKVGTLSTAEYEKRILRYLKPADPKA